MDVINVRDGGLAIYGGIIGALVFGSITAKIRKLKVSSVLDLAALGFLIGQGVGRWGNFFNQEAHGSLVENPDLQFFPYAVYLDDPKIFYGRKIVIFHKISIPL